LGQIQWPKSSKTFDIFLYFSRKLISSEQELHVLNEWLDMELSWFSGSGTEYNK